MLKFWSVFLFGVWIFDVIRGDTCTWNNCNAWSNDPNVWNVHFIPHTHDDVGWLKTADGYYSTEVRYIINTYVTELLKNSSRRMTYCETGFLVRWIADNPDKVSKLRQLIQNGQLEIIGGGWVQPDEGASHYYELLDVFTVGLKLLNSTFGTCAGVPKAAWQIDPFGHSREVANLYSMMGYESLWFAREHYTEQDFRKANRTLQMTWHTSDDNNNQIFTGVFFGGYGTAGGFCFDINCHDEPIQDNPNLENYNLDSRLSDFLNLLNQMNATQQTNHFMVLMGSDFQYQDANMYFVNLDKLIYHLNQNYPNIKAFYSTPACYTQAVKNISGIQWPSKTTDFFPYATSPHDYFTGYFTSKPALKRLVRKSSALLQLIRQLQSLALTTWTSDIGDQIEILERAVALSQHHDGITGTSKEFVTQDYIFRLTKGWTAIEPVINNAMQTISQRLKNNLVQLPQQIICRTINESECLFTKTNNVFTVTVHNGNGQILNSLIRIPLYQNSASVVVTDNDGNSVVSQINQVFSNSGQINNSNIAPYEVAFLATVGPIGFRSYFVTVTPSIKFNQKMENNEKPGANSISNGLIQLDFDSNGLLSTYTDLTTTTSYPLTQSFSYYFGAMNQSHETQKSGAYIFRPDPDNPKPVGFTGSVTLSIVNGSSVAEAKQIISSWVSQTIRLVPNKKLIEFEWTIGPIPRNDNKSKELITTYSISSLNNSGQFYTDANGRQLMKRQRDSAIDYTYTATEPIAANYYPIDSRIIISDGTTSLTILTDRSHGGSSIKDGQVEIMLHRRDLVDDGFGVAEALSEPGRDGRGLVVRGKHWLAIGSVSDVTPHRSLAFEIFHQPVLTFSTYTSIDQYRTDFVTDFSGLGQQLPANINLLTLKQLDANTVLIRLEHIYQKIEDPTLSQPVTIDLSTLIPSYKLTSVQEVSLANNVILNSNVNAQVTLNPMDIKTYRLTVSSTTGCSCQTAWTPSDIDPCNCYKFVQTPKNWVDANNDCKTQNARSTLVSVDSAFDNNDLTNLGKNTQPSCPQFFLGLNQLSGSGWTWINNDQSAYRNWQSGYPQTGATLNCTELSVSNGKWTNIDCATATGCYICEVKNG